jgi:hypothetical protein
MLVGQQDKLFADFRIGETHTAWKARLFPRHDPPHIDLGQRRIRHGEELCKWFEGQADQTERRHDAPRIQEESHGGAFRARSLAVFGH